jgi:hypothetical protein
MRKNHQKHKFYVTAMIIATVGLITAIVLMILNSLGCFNKTEDAGFVQNSVLEQHHYEQLGYDLQLLGVGRYSGQFLEDGSNDLASDVLMVEIQNTGDKDLRLAGLSLTYTDFTAEFEITNLPAGKSVVVLEKNRRTYTAEEHLSVKLRDVVFFKENMDVFSDTFRLTGMNGAINVENISDTSISSDLYVYYKYISGDTLYGGITFRAKISGGLAPGELRQISAAHFDPDQCVVMWISGEQ